MPELIPSQPETFTEHIEAFVTAINFSEPLLLAILTTDVLLFISSVCVRSQTKRSVLLFGQLFYCLALGPINDYCRQSWQRIATQNYFDPHGLFLSILVGLPVLLNCFIILMKSLTETIRLLARQAAKAKKD